MLRFSALSIDAGVVPRLGCLLAPTTARLLAICPPIDTMTPLGFHTDVENRLNN